MADRLCIFGGTSLGGDRVPNLKYEFGILTPVKVIQLGIYEL